MRETSGPSIPRNEKKITPVVVAITAWLAVGADVLPLQAEVSNRSVVTWHEMLDSNSRHKWQSLILIYDGKKELTPKEHKKNLRAIRESKPKALYPNLSYLFYWRTVNTIMLQVNKKLEDVTWALGNADWILFTFPIKSGSYRWRVRKASDWKMQGIVIDKAWSPVVIKMQKKAEALNAKYPKYWVVNESIIMLSSWDRNTREKLLEWPLKALYKEVDNVQKFAKAYVEYKKLKTDFDNQKTIESAYKLYHWATALHSIFPDNFNETVKEKVWIVIKTSKVFAEFKELENEFNNNPSVELAEKIQKKADELLHLGELTDDIASLNYLRTWQSFT
jgi:hypothetical protein